MIATISLDGEALAWFQWEEGHRPIKKWGDLKCRLIDRFRHMLTGSEYVHKFYDTTTKRLLSNPRQTSAIKLVDQIYEWLWIKTPLQNYDTLPKDYYLVPSNNAIKLSCGFSQL